MNYNFEKGYEPKDGTKADIVPMPIETTSSKTIAKTPISSSLSYETLAVIIKTKSGKYFQVGLTKEMCDCLFIDLKNYFTNDIIKVLPDEILGIEFGIRS